MTVAELVEELKKVDPKNQVELEIINPEATQGVIGNGPTRFTWSADFSGL